MNLKVLELNHTQISDIEPLKELKKLKTITVANCPNISDEQVKDLQKALPYLIRR